MSGKENGIEYLMIWKDSWPKSVISSNEAKLKWPLLTLEFLEQHLFFLNRSNQMGHKVQSKMYTGTMQRVIHYKCAVSNI